MKDPRLHSGIGPAAGRGYAMAAASGGARPPGGGSDDGGGRDSGETAPFGGRPSAPATPYGNMAADGDEQEDPGLAAGTQLGKYQILRKLGSGGMGAVYEAIHTGISKAVALKTLSRRLASESRAQTRFLREAAAASRLDHPHVVAVTDFGTDDGVTYLVMELLRGEDLGELLAREVQGLSVERTADVMLAVCAGVFAAHEVGVIHRDLKPQNIFLARTPVGEVVPKVLDFGISKLVDEEMAMKSNLTGTGTVVGTTHYLSPEQVSGRALDPRSDQYTLGVILYECATGQRPHDGETLFAVMRSIAEARFRPPRALRPDLPAEFEAVVLRAMSTDPGRRFESVHALGAALLAFATPKRRVMWADYFQGGAGAVPTGPIAVTPESGKPLPLGRVRTPAGQGTPRRGLPSSRPYASLSIGPPPAERSREYDAAAPRSHWLRTLLIASVLVGAVIAGWRYLERQGQAIRGDRAGSAPIPLPVTPAAREEPPMASPPAVPPPSSAAVPPASESRPPAPAPVEPPRAESTAVESRPTRPPRAKKRPARTRARPDSGKVPILD